MASGWWKSTHANLAAGSPVDFEVTASPKVPRGFPKLASIATGAGHFLGGTPSVVIGDVIYYAGDDYVQDTDKPILCRYDGRTSTEVLEIPYITGTTPAKAILSLCADDDGNIYISTWDSGTTSANFAGRVFEVDGDTFAITTLNSSTFTGGILPYGLAFFNDRLYVGATKQDPASAVNLYNIRTDIRSGGPTPTVTPATSSVSYQVRRDLTGAYSEIVSKTIAPTLDSTYYANPQWTASSNTWRVIRTAGQATQGKVGDTAAGVGSFNDTGIVATTQAAGTPSISVSLTVQYSGLSTTTTYRVGAVVDGVEYLSSAVSANANGTLTSSNKVTISWGAVDGATSYKVYRSAGHSSTGLISTTTATSVDDTGLAGTGTVPTAFETSSVGAIPSGATGCMAVYSSDLYVGTYQPASTFGRVYKVTSGGVISLSDEVAPGGSATAYNGFTAAIVFEGNLYMGYWNDDATDITLIRKFTGSAWSTVETISGAGARPIMCFAEADGNCWAYGGGDGKTGILYSSPDGTTWTDRTSLLPTSVEAIPFIGSVSVLGGF